MTAVAFVLKGYPRLSETFIAQEILALERRGLDIRIFSLRRPTDLHRHPVHDEIRAPVTYLPEYLYQEPLRVMRAWRSVRHRPGYLEARSAWLRDLARDPSPNRIRRFGQALVMARELTKEVSWVHAHFLHTPASVARYAAKMVDLPWSCSAHAKDIWTTPEWEKKEKLADSQWVVSCTRTNVAHLSALAPVAGRVGLAYHGLDHDRFPPPEGKRLPRHGADAADPVVILSVGRAVEKKGFSGVLEALSRLPETLHWRFVHIGAGPLLRKLKRQAASAGLDDRVHWVGPLPQGDILRHYRAADVFVLNCRVADDGDRDGLPNVLVEAQSQGLACLSTTASAVPELIENGETGLLVPPASSDELARALQRLIQDPLLRERLGRAAAVRVREHFSLSAGVGHIAGRFGLSEAPEQGRRTRTG